MHRQFEQPVYLNTAAAGLQSPQVVQTIQAHLQLESECGGYVAAEKVQLKLAQCRESLSRLLNCSPSEIALTDSASRAWQRILDCFDFQRDDIVLVSPTIWGGNYFTLLQLERRFGIQVQCMPTEPDGNVDLDRLKQQIQQKVRQQPNSRVRFMELTLAPSGWDAWQATVEIAQLARAHSIPLVVDASQALGQRELDVNDLGCDFLFASGRKWLAGPRGTGVLYARQSSTSNLCPLGLDQHTGFLKDDELHWLPDARRFELSESSVALRLGLGEAAKQTLSRQQAGESVLLKKLAADYRRLIAEIAGFELPDCSGDLGAIVTFRHAVHSPVAVRDFLRQHHIEVGIHPRTYMPLHAPTQRLGDCLRVSPSTCTHNPTDALRYFLGKLASL